MASDLVHDYGFAVALASEVYRDSKPGDIINLAVSDWLFSPQIQ